MQHNQDVRLMSVHNRVLASIMAFVLAFGLSPIGNALGEENASADSHSDNTAVETQADSSNDSLALESMDDDEEMSLADAKIKWTSGNTATYNPNGEASIPPFTVTYFGETLEKGSDKDYTVADVDTTKPGEYTLTLKPAPGSRFAEAGETKTAKFTVTAAINSTNCSVDWNLKNDGYYAYTGSAIEPVPTVTLRATGTKLKKDTDYTLVYSNNKSGSNATVTVKGKGYYSSSVYKTFHIVNIQSRVYRSKKWTSYVNLGSTAGASSGTTKVGCMSLKLASNGGLSGDIQYTLYNKSWSKTKSNGATCGVSGVPAQAMTVKLTGNLAKKFDVYYRVRISGGGWMGWAKNGEKAGIINLNSRMKMTGYQVQLVAKGGKAPGSTSMHYSTSYDSYAKYVLYENIKDKSSNTKYMIAADTTLNRMAIYYRKSSSSNWKRIKYYKIATGVSSYPSNKGNFTLGSKRYRIDSGQSSYWYFRTYSGSLGFHSILTWVGNQSKAKPAVSKQLGRNASHGCIRQPMSMAKYVYYNIPSGTHVTVTGLV